VVPEAPRRPEGSLNDDQRAGLLESGYLVVRRLFEPAELRPWITRLGELVSGEAEASEGMLIMRDVMVAKGVVRPERPADAVAKVQDFDGDPVLRTYTEHPRLLEFVEPIVGGDIVSIHCMLINKPPGVDGRHPFHQDLLYFPFRPADRILGAWTALEPVDRENGCLSVVPGSHRGGLSKHVNPDWDYLNMGYFAAEGVGAHPGRVHLEMQPGDTVFFHPLLLHGSGRNRSSGYRRAISSHFADAACRYPEGVDRSGNRRYRLLRGRVQPGGILAP
jgi:phytanoyl-CoA hydroxylase